MEEKKYFLDADQTIIYDVEEKVIRFSDDPARVIDLKNSTRQEWELFMLLMTKAGQNYPSAMLSNDGAFGENGLKTYAFRLRKLLNDEGIETNRGNENDKYKITIGNNRSRIVHGQETGSYFIKLPEKNKKQEEDIANLFWDRYEYLSVKKDADNKEGELTAKLGNAYQFPEFTAIEKNNGAVVVKKNFLIEAPNGYGKTTFMRSILLAATYPYRKNLSEEEKLRYAEIRKFYGIKDSFFCIYLQCKDMVFGEQEAAEDIAWLYNSLKSDVSIRISPIIDKTTFNCLVAEYNKKGKLLLLVDGLDEISSETRNTLLRKLKCFQDNEAYGNESKIILTSRPLFWPYVLHDFQKYSISNEKLLNNKDAFIKFLGSYAGSTQKYFNEIHAQITSNPYIADVIRTPVAIVWAALAYRPTDNFCVWINRILVAMMIRFDLRGLVTNLEAYEKVYELISYKTLQAYGEKGIPVGFFDVEFTGLVKQCIGVVGEEKIVGFEKVFSNKDVSELFYTNVALMESDGSYLKFSSKTYAYHLAAKYVVRMFAKNKNSLNSLLNDLPIENRYIVALLVSSLVVCVGYPGVFSGFSQTMDPEDWDEMAEILYEYFRNGWESSHSRSDEKIHIQDAVAQILMKDYGENIFTRTKREKDYTQEMDEILIINLGACTDAVKRYRSKEDVE